jgi:predicted AlkP superfamily phosphohydrolase/phosphomutase
MMVEMGTDRVHHAFWQYMDPAHHRYERGNPFETVIADYYEHVDAQVGRLLEVLPADATSSSSPTTAPSAWQGGSR